MAAQPQTQVRPASTNLDPRAAAQAALQAAAARLQQSDRLEISPASPDAPPAQSPALRALSRHLAAVGMAAVAFNAAAKDAPSAQVKAPAFNRSIIGVMNDPAPEPPSRFARTMEMLGIRPSPLTFDQTQMVREAAQVSGRTIIVTDTSDILGMRAGAASFLSSRPSADPQADQDKVVQALIQNRAGLSVQLGRLPVPEGSEVSQPPASIEPGTCLVGAPLSSKAMDSVSRNLIVAHELGHCSLPPIPGEISRAEVYADAYSALTYLRQQDVEDRALPNLEPLKDLSDARLLNAFLGDDFTHDSSKVVTHVMQQYGNREAVLALQRMTPEQIAELSRSIALSPGMSQTDFENDTYVDALSKARYFNENLSQRTVIRDTGKPEAVFLMTPSSAAELADRLESAVRTNPDVSEALGGGVPLPNLIHSLRAASVLGQLPLDYEGAEKVANMSIEEIQQVAEEAERLSEPVGETLRHYHPGQGMAPG